VGLAGADAGRVPGTSSTGAYEGAPGAAGAGVKTTCGTVMVLEPTVKVVQGTLGAGTAETAGAGALGAGADGAGAEPTGTDAAALDVGAEPAGGAEAAGLVAAGAVGVVGAVGAAGAVVGLKTSDGQLDTIPGFPGTADAHMPMKYWRACWTCWSVPQEATQSMTFLVKSGILQ
jgi:hypothetical protein